jgi:hypothetical protein
MTLVETSSLGIGLPPWWTTGLGFGAAALDLTGSVVLPLWETAESARFSRVAPMVAVRWLLVGGSGGVDGLMGEVESTGGVDEVA